MSIICIYYGYYANVKTTDEKSRRIKIAKHTAICYLVSKKFERDSQQYVPMDRLLSFG
ncbi:MAG: hypothetical protein PVF36_13125 [Desulfobacterales bacterium]